MRVGRLRTAQGVEPFLLLKNGRALPWRALDASGTPEPLRDALRRACGPGDSEAFCAALPLLEEFAVSGGAERLAQQARELPDALEPPVIPRSFVCIGLNYRDHAIESGAQIPKQPLLFAKTGNALSGHNHPVRLPPTSTQVDYEAELAVIIGRRCSRVSAVRALDYVAGYTCANDVSARDFQFNDGQWYRGKTSDTFGPIGPFLVSRSEIADPQKLQIVLRLNGPTMQDSSTSNLIFGVAELIEFISRTITLFPGDVISTGTPPGVGFARKPPVYLKPGDIMEVEVEKVGVLRNPVEASKSYE
jgi:2-keto-4-pentenoate hydratase/2-oxohepta-3-ene-1,7-dioic acid hydratase in catechol pathway